MTAPLILALPTDDRVRAHAFYRDGLGFAAPGAPEDDGVPEPLQLVVADGVRLTAAWYRAREAERSARVAPLGPIAQKVHQQDVLIPIAILKKMADLGVFGLTIPEAFLLHANELIE